MTFNKKVIIALVFISALFLLLIIYLSYFQLFKSEELANAGGNPRTYLKEEKILRGSIYDQNGTCLAYSEFADGRQKRMYPFNRLYSNLIGYTSKKYGRFLIENSFNNYLIGNDYNTSIIDVISSNELTEGADLNLTVDNDLQLLAADLLGERKGAVVAIEPATGKILAMVSKPWFNPNEEELDNNWDKLCEDDDNVFFPRATMGLYPPGSSFKTIVATSAVENMMDSEEYDDTGSIEIYGKVFENYGGKAYGNIEIKKAFAVSSNSYFINLADKLGYNKIKDTASKFLFGQEIAFDIPVSVSCVLESNDRINVAAVGMGQGDALSTPFNMALAAAGIANNGIIMKPYVVESAVYQDGNVGYQAKRKQLIRCASPYAASKVQDMMIECVKSGTGTGAAVSGITVAGKTGTAENASGKDHAWFIAYAPAEDPQIAVAVLIENAGTTGSVASVPIAKQIISKWLKK